LFCIGGEWCDDFVDIVWLSCALFGGKS